MRKEYIMSEDDKREKRKKIEKNREIKKRAVDEGTDSSNDSKKKIMRLEKEDEKQEEDDDEEEDEQSKKTKCIKPVKINLLNMASASKKTYQKKQSKYNSNPEQFITFPSPELPEISPETVTESRTCNVFNDISHELNSSQSRSVEIYQFSKSKEERKQTAEANTYSDSNIIQIILDSEFSKPSEVYTNSTVSKPLEEDKVCNYKDKYLGGGDYVISESDVMELTKNNQNIMLETTKEGKKILVLSKEPSSGWEKSFGRPSDVDDLEATKKFGSMNSFEEEVDTPLLSSLINSRRSSDGVHNMSSSKTIVEGTFQDTSRYVQSQRNL